MCSCCALMWLGLKRPTQSIFQIPALNIKKGTQNPQMITDLSIPNFPLLFFSYMNINLQNVSPWWNWPWSMSTCWETLSVLTLAKQWAAVSTQFWLTMDPEHGSDCKGGECQCVKSTLKYQTKGGGGNDDSLIILFTDLQSFHQFHSDVPGSGVGWCIIILPLLGDIFLSYPTHCRTLVTLWNIII